MNRRTLAHAGALALAAGQLIAAPLWWSERGVTDSNTTSDFSPANTGQIKWTALQAFHEIDAHVPRGNSEEAAALVNGWLSNLSGGQNFAACNIGQGKQVASILYQGLASAGLNVSLPVTSDPAQDYAPILVGQAKALFDFNVFGIPSDPAADPVITEVVAQGSTYPSGGAGPATDWIEIYNPTAATIDLHDYWLTADGGSYHDTTGVYEQETWQFPSGTTLAPGAYLVVLAPGGSSSHSTPLKTTFGLSADGEYLALLRGPGKVVCQQFFPILPKMTAGRSFGLTADLKQATFFQTPTPGAVNGASLAATTLLAPPVIVPARGFKTSSFSLTIQKPTPGSQVYYRLGGDLPSRNVPTDLYDPQNPPTISGTTIVRAYAVEGSGSNRRESEVATSSFIFPANVLTQTRPSHYPTSVPGYRYWFPPAAIPLSYDMNSTVAGNSTAEILTALTAIPSISFVLPLDSLFDVDPDPDRTHDALFQESSYDAPSVVASFEWLDPRSGKPSMQRNMEVELSGDTSLLWETIKKKSFKVRFNKGHLDDGVRFDFFDTGQPEWVSALAIKNPASDSWANFDPSMAANSLYIADQMVARSYRAMSRPGSVNIQPDNRLVHVYINGLYWGVYVMHERPDEAYMAKRKGGAARNYEAFGDIGGPGYDDPSQVNLDSYFDYILAASFHYVLPDWPGNNRSGSNATGSREWEFFTWGLEFLTMEYPGPDPGWVFDRAGEGELAIFHNHVVEEQTPSLREKFAEHLEASCGPGGALSRASMHARLDALSNEFLTVAIAESARWGAGYDGTKSPPYGLSDLAVQRAVAEDFIDNFLYEQFEEFNTRLDLGLTNPYPAP